MSAYSSRRRASRLRRPLLRTPDPAGPGRPSAFCSRAWTGDYKLDTQNSSLSEANSEQSLVALPMPSTKTYTFFLNECFEAGPDHCALSRQTDINAQNIQDRIDALIDRLQEQPLAVANSTRPGYITSGDVRLTLFLAIQMPDYLPRFFTYIARAMDGDGAELLRFVKRASPPPDSQTGPDEDGYVYIAQENLSRLAISCGDALPRTQEDEVPTAEEIVDAVLGTVRDVSPRFGATAHMIEQHGGCHYWPGTGVGPARYRGPWNNTLATLPAPSFRTP
ncbi:Abhydrolase-4 domain-containing protein [Mycena chlorophos]|uniref:Abhydrolase-4 domain-containing protein n=1 Tax=Mycena chlorophos TaxID=658473 RepID=A0A8H6SRX2_MYCCL|nr:Abhydrolase-4 domain-containing protein [Mycena chlorophos]